eukprot:Opistho-2@10589
MGGRDMALPIHQREGEGIEEQGHTSRHPRQPQQAIGHHQQPRQPMRRAPPCERQADAPADRQSAGDFGQVDDIMAIQRGAHRQHAARQRKPIADAMRPQPQSAEQQRGGDEPHARHQRRRIDPVDARAQPGGVECGAHASSSPASSSTGATGGQRRSGTPTSSTAATLAMRTANRAR